MLTFYPLALTDTMIDLVRRNRADTAIRESAAYREAMAKAKTNMDVLVAQGVITFDDGYGEMCRSYAWDNAKKRAEREGVTHAIAEGRNQYEGEAANMKRLLERAATTGETEPERAARTRAARDAVPFGVRDGDKKCKHNATQRERGWISWQTPDRDDSERWTCCRCGAFVDVPHNPPEPTPAAQIAAALFHNEAAMAITLADADVLTAEAHARHEAQRAAETARHVARIDREIAARNARDATRTAGACTR